MRLIDDWRRVIKRAWSVRVAIFWLIVSSLSGVWFGLSGALPVWAFVIGGISLSVSVGLARLLKQPGVDCE